MTPNLRTERLELMPYAPEDEDDFVGLLSDEEVCRWMGQSAQPEEVIRGLFRHVFPEIYGKNLFDVWAVRFEGRYVGHAEIKKTGNVDGHEIIIALVRDVWRMGFGSELTRAVMDYGFDVLNLTEVHGMVGGGNKASLAMSAKLGFERVRDVTNDDGTITHVVTAQRRPAALASPE